MAEEKAEEQALVSEVDWRHSLDEETYHVLREGGTEAPFSSSLNNEKRAGVFFCAGCDEPLFSSEAKYNSGSGWPSFKHPTQDDALLLRRDGRFGMERVEVCCARCGGHLGHVFDDGPAPLGKRYCINGLAMTFMPGE